MKLTHVLALFAGCIVGISAQVCAMETAQREETLLDCIVRADNTACLRDAINSGLYGSALSNIDLTPVIERVDEAVLDVKNAVKNGANLPNVLLWGPGSAVVALKMARSCGLEVMLFGPRHVKNASLEEASKKVDDLFRNAGERSKKVMIIIQELERLAPSRQKMNESTKEAQARLSAFLKHIGTKSSKYMVVALTNRPHEVDEAFVTRFDVRIEVPAAI